MAMMASVDMPPPAGFVWADAVDAPAASSKQAAVRAQAGLPRSGLTMSAVHTHNTNLALPRPVPLQTAALLFDCDGVLVETEELHRLAYNEAFAAFGLETAGAPVEWSVAYYDVLQNTVGGGKPKMKFHFTETVKEWPAVRGMGGRPTPADEAAGMALVDELHLLHGRRHEDRRVRRGVAVVDVQERDGARERVHVLEEPAHAERAEGRLVARPQLRVARQLVVDADARVRGDPRAVGPRRRRREGAVAQRPEVLRDGRAVQRRVAAAEASRRPRAERCVTAAEASRRPRAEARESGQEESHALLPKALFDFTMHISCTPRYT